MEIIQVVGLGIIAATLIMIIKVSKPELAIQVSMAAGIIIFLMIAGKLSAVVQLLESYSSKSGINIMYFNILLKIIGIAYIAEFGAQICKDAGESAIASKIELAGKVVIMVLAVPIVTSLVELIINIMP